ncbi:hypothetical protein L484_003830 [Morus notabilis]|uniref:Uncharacterized protein n=1 Tax=Morus notabilis TaxID=981085 RepID=W9QCU4_9ROSA|nr:hypothetical protein L484_003830 [Morus notabilis]
MTDIARLERRLKRRSVANSYFGKKSNRNALTVVENNQAKEMPELVEYRNSVSSSTYEHGDYDCYDDQNQDPHYNMFLNNVKKDGQSYALVVSQKNDVPDLLKYEIVDLVGDDECGAAAPEAIEAPPEAIESYPVNRKIKGIRILRWLSCGENVEIPDSSTSFSSIRDAWSPRTLRYRARNSRKGEISGTSDGGVSKRRKVRSAGRNVGRETTVRSGLEGNCLIEYEFDREGDDECGAEAPEAIEAPPEAIKSYPVNRKIKGIRILRWLSCGENVEIPDSSTSFSSIRDAWSPRTLRYRARNSRKGEISGTSDGGVSKRRKVCSAGRNVGRETGVRSGLEGNCLIEYEFDREGDDECGAEAPEAIEAPPEAIESYPVNRKIKGIRILRSLSRRENTEIPDSSTSFSSIRDAWSPRTLRYHARNSRKGEISGTSDGGVSKRRKVCSAGRNVGRETSVRSGLEGNCLIEYEFDREGDADDDVLSERRKSRLPRRRAGKEHRGPKSSGTSLRSGSENTQLVENEFDHDNDEDDDDVAEEYIRCPSSGYGGIGSEGNCSEQHLSDHEGEFEDDYIRCQSSGYRGIGSKGNFSEQHLSDHEGEFDEEYIKILNSGYLRTCSEGNFSAQRQNDDVLEDFSTYLDSVECRDPARGGTNRQSNRRPRSKVSHLVERECDWEDFFDDADQEYLRFLHQLDKDGEASTYKIDDSPERSNKVEECESDVEIIEMDKDPYRGGTTPFVSSKQQEQIDVDDYSLAEDPSMACSQFKKGLMEDLKRPYDSRELETLKENVSRRNPVLRDRVMRKSTKSYPMEHKRGKSYLDLYSDFAKELDQVKNDNLKSLNLLRGFFYWLKHLTQDKGFMPWRDPSCLEVRREIGCEQFM